MESLARLKLNSPDKWQALLDLGKTPNLCTYGFKYGKTVEQCDKEIDLIISSWEWQKKQISFYDNKAEYPLLEGRR